MIKKENLFVLALIVLSLISCNKRNSDIYVSPAGSDNNAGTIKFPVHSIEKALDIAGSDRKKINEHKTIHILEGDYHLSAPLLITPQLSNVTIIGEGVNKVIVKGSKALKTNWKTFDKNIVVTSVEDDIDFDQLFINGKKQILARYPNYDENGGHWQGSAEDAVSKERVSTWKNPVGGFVHAMHSGLWGDFHYEITGVDEKGELILKGGFQNNRPSPMHPKYRFVENIFEELDSENEWYFNKKEKKLYLWPDSNTDLASVVVEVSVLKHLVELKGSENGPVRNVIIEGIRFEHAKRTFMERYHKLLRSDWTIYRGGSVLFDGTESCSVTNCEFTNLGGNVIFVNAYNRKAEIAGNHIHDCGASAICFVGNTTAVRSPSYQYFQFVPFQKMDTVSGPANNLYPSECDVENNLIYRIGRIEKQVAGVQISMSMKIHVKNNSIYDVPRAGINVSEGTWGGHVIEYNDVFNTVLETGDHGSFNSWGRDRFWHPNRNVMNQLVKANPQMPYWDAMYTTTIRNNRFRCNHGWDIDLDDGSSNYHIYNNLCLNGGIKLREGFYRVVENNIMINNGFHPHVWFENSGDVFRRNILTTKYFPISLRGWGKEIDYNLFPDSVSLAFAQENNTDKHSAYGNPIFVNPEKGDFRVSENSPAVKLGFLNFDMDSFGVQKTELKAIAKRPDIPGLNVISFRKNSSKTKEWLGAILKNIETREEQSAYGLFNTEGVIILKVDEASKTAKAGFKAMDVIVAVEKKKVKDIADLLTTYMEVSWHNKVAFTVIRSQKETEVILNLQ